MINSEKTRVQNEIPNQKLKTPDEQLLRSIDEDKNIEDMKGSQKITYIVYAVLIVLGVLTGFALTRSTDKTDAKKTENQIVDDSKTVGSTDTKTFKDSAIGVIEAGGIEGEGTHKLVREGGPSQTAYLTSSVIDLDEFVGQKVTVWGQTMAAEKAPWLMDVGKIEIQ